MGAFIHTLKQARADSNEGGEVSWIAMWKNFSTPVWQNTLGDFCDYLKKHCAGSNPDLLNYDKLVMIGLLYCQDSSKPKAKAEALYDLLQDGGKEKHAMITAMDKDWKDVLSHMFELATFIAAEEAEYNIYYGED